MPDFYLDFLRLHCPDSLYDAYTIWPNLLPRPSVSRERRIIAPPSTSSLSNTTLRSNHTPAIPLPPSSAHSKHGNIP